jgi:hypothetical protein
MSASAHQHAADQRIAKRPSPGSRTSRRTASARRVIGFLNDHDRAARTLPDHFRGNKQIDQQRIVILEIGV